MQSVLTQHSAVQEQVVAMFAESSVDVTGQL